MIDYITQDQTSAVIRLEPIWDDVVPVLLVANNYTVAQISVTIRALLESREPETRYDVIIAHINISEQNMAVVQEMVESEEHFVVRFAKVSPLMNNRYFGFRRRFVEVDLLKIFSPLILRNYPKMILLQENCLPLVDLMSLSANYTYDTCLGMLPQASGVQFYNLEQCRQKLPVRAFVDAVRKEQNRSVAAVQENIFHKRIQLIETKQNELQLIQYWKKYPWEDLKVAHSDVFWSLARNTPYYEHLRLRLYQ